jgi:prepilin-type N-terminal cleavage/methylation domain-containing protein
MKKTRKSISGFSLLELMFVVAILTVVMGVVFQQIVTVQKTSKAEDTKQDLTQEGREFMDTFIRDVHQSGFPGTGMYSVAMASTDNRVAVGLVKFAYDEVWLEADVNGDGQVDTINYKLTTASGSGQCPCKITRSQVAKANGTAPDSQTISPTTELTDVINSGGANGGSSGTAAYSLYGSVFTGGASRTIESVYSNYKPANVFTAYDASGNEISPATYSTGSSTLASIKTIKINLNLLGRQGDLQTGMRAVIPLTASSRVGGN